VANPGATLCYVAGGFKRMKYPSTFLSTYFRTPKVRRYKKRSLNLAAGLAARSATALMRAWGKVGGPKGKGEFELMAEMDEWPDIASPNLLINSSARMMNFRFPVANYLIYKVYDNHETPTFVVFSRPFKDMVVELSHWTAPVSFPAMVGVVRDVLRRCGEAC